MTITELVKGAIDGTIKCMQGGKNADGDLVSYMGELGTDPKDITAYGFESGVFKAIDSESWNKALREVTAELKRQTK